MAIVPTTIHSVAQVRAMDAHAIAAGIPGYTLMSRAGAAAFDLLRRRWPTARKVTVVCGSGNNAGDGYVVARLARAAGLDVDTIALSDPGSLQGDAAKAWQEFAGAGGKAVEWTDDAIESADVIVDAIFGTGLSRPLDAQYCPRVAAINAGAAPVLALDVPSGLHGDSGRALGAAVKADCTISFVGLKVGLLVGDAPDHVGELAFDALGVPEMQIDTVARRMDERWLATVLPRRSRLAHKGSNGHVLIIGGNRGMAGAVRLAGEAALRVGAGLVSVVTHIENVAAVVSGRPELMVRGIERADDLPQSIQRADIVAIGPGLGQDEWSSTLLDVVLASDLPLVVDADALNLLARKPRQRSNWVLTPHPGEAARLLGTTTAAIQNDRLSAVRELAEKFGGVAVLKGARSLVARGGDVPVICDRGNPGMATAGMGDVLTGTVAGIAAQVDDLWVAAQAAVFGHALAGDVAAADGERGLIASDLFASLRRIVNP